MLHAARLLTALAFTALLAVPAVASATPGAARSAHTVTLHVAPDSAAPDAGTVPPRAWMRVLDTYTAPGGDWYRVSAGRRTGWAAANGLSVRTSMPAAKAPACRARASRAIGTPGQGRLRGAVLMPASGPDHFAWNFRRQRIGHNASTRWGTCGTVRKLLRGIAAYRRAHPDAPQVAVGDLSKRRGGEISRHSTHENGTVVDLYFPRRDKRRAEPRSVAQVDMRLSRALVAAMLRAGAKKVLVGPNIKIKTGGRVIRWPNHDDHAHVIF